MADLYDDARAVETAALRAEIARLRKALTGIAGHHPMTRGLSFEGNYKLLSESAINVAVSALGLPTDSAEKLNAALDAVHEQNASEVKP